MMGLMVDDTYPSHKQIYEVEKNGGKKGKFNCVFCGCAAKKKMGKKVEKIIRELQWVVEMQYLFSLMRKAICLFCKLIEVFENWIKKKSDSNAIK